MSRRTSSSDPRSRADAWDNIDRVLLSHDQDADLTMDANDAIEAAHAFPDAAIVPVHTDGWAHLTESGEALRAAFSTLGSGNG